jgi:hypothetical protein
VKKHTKTLLSLNCETIRCLVLDDLSCVAGGLDDTAFCPNTKGCPFPVLTDKCTGKVC